jgi:hypothetical protein
MLLTRRTLLAGVLLAAATAGQTTLAETVVSAHSDTDRRAARWRRRRVIYNNDGDDVWSKIAESVEQFLAQRHDPLLGTQVDSIWYSTTQSFHMFSHETKVAEIFKANQGPFTHNHLPQFLAQHTDGLRMSCDFAHRHGLESFWSLRMNDIHDAFESQMVSTWKKTHPEALMGRQAEAESLTDRRRLWTLVDFEHPEVESLIVSVVEEVLRGYDIDGIELDFMRAPFYFRSHYQGQPVTKEQASVLTRLLSAVRRVVLEVSEEKKRPILLAARIPATLTACERMGVDAREWLRGGLLDLVVLSGGYVAFDNPVREMIELAHAHDVPAYPCLSQSGLNDRPPGSPARGSYQPLPTAYWRGAALRLWEDGADGMYTFNLFPNATGSNDAEDARRRDYCRDVVSSIGSPETLHSRERVFAITDAAAAWADAFWAKDTEAWSQSLPLALPREETAVARLVVAGPIDITAPEKSPPMATRHELWLDFTDLPPGVRPQVHCNMGLLADPSREEPRPAARRLVYALPAGLARTGENRIELRSPVEGAQLTSAQLWLLQDPS